MAIVIELGILVVLVAVFSAWAHKAQCNHGLWIALYVVTAAISVIVLLVGVTSSLVNLSGTSGHVSFNSMLEIAVGVAIGLPLLRPVRLAFARVMPFDPNSPADMIGLSVLLATAVLSGGTSLHAGTKPDVTSVSALELVTQAIAFILIAYFGVGLLINRGLRGATERLGLKSVSLRQLGYATLLVVALFAVTIISSILTHYLEPNLDKQIQQNLGTMTQNLSSFGGALLLGISAGVGEEILFRGAVQPRFGIVFTSIVFASLHVQYGISLTIIGIFCVSVLLGLERRRVNTTASIVTHVLYDTAAVLLSLLTK